MTKWKKLSHTIYQCKYHIVWCPKYRYRILKGQVAEFVEQTLRMLCEWRSIEILEMNVKESRSEKTLIRLESKFEKYDLVIADELGYISFDKEGQSYSLPISPLGPVENPPSSPLISPLRGGMKSFQIL